MKRSALLLTFLFLSLAILPLVSAELNNTQINKAYDCLQDKINDKTCDKLGLDEKIFSVLAVRKCKSELINSSKNNECWPNPTCNVVQTSQAIMALSKVANTGDAETWLVSQNTTPTEIEWYLQIESSEASICTLSYGGLSYPNVAVSEDKKISGSTGSCLLLSDNEYWLRISPTCYDREFEISCDKQFITNLLFKEKDSSTIHINSETSSASANGFTTEKVNSACFKKGNSCDYESTLWATMVLSDLDYDVSAYYPYLITFENDYDKFLPSAFLYSLTADTDYFLDLISKQKTAGYWQESGDEYFDTALAMYSIKYDDAPEKDKAVEWLMEKQEQSGCWDLGSIKNTGFILHAIWPEYYSGDDEGGISLDCEGANGFCMSRVSCEDAGGLELEDYTYSCSGTNICCDKEQLAETCAELKGEICSSSEYCIGGTEFYSDDAGPGEVCCIDGTCQAGGGTSSGGETTTEEFDCESYGGTCRSFECQSDETESTTYSCDFGDVCCMKKKSQSLWWIWVLIILIILVAVGIVFKDKVKEFWFKLSGKFSNLKPKPSSGSPLIRSPMGMSPRRILPQSQRRRPQRTPARKSPNELDDVLKKLKEMGK